MKKLLLGLACIATLIIGTMATGDTPNTAPTQAQIEGPPNLALPLAEVSTGIEALNLAAITTVTLDLTNANLAETANNNEIAEDASPHLQSAVNAAINVISSPNATGNTMMAKYNAANHSDNDSPDAIRGTPNANMAYNAAANHSDAIDSPESTAHGSIAEPNEIVFAT